MAPSYDEAVATLYQASFGEFVAERKRLAAELKAASDKAGAVRLGKLTRPTLASWAVNQLWWTGREDFDALFAAAQRLREGDLSASEARRDALGKLRARAGALLAEANQAASDATLRRVATTLSALAAAGSFAPDVAGQLVADRDPPGFESVGSVQGPALRPVAPAPQRDIEDARRLREDEEARERAATAERRRLEEERARADRERQRAERERLERSLRSVKSEIERRARDLERMRSELAEAESELEKSRATAREIEARLSSPRGEKGSA